MPLLIVPNKADIEQIKSIPILDVWRRYGGGELKPRGKELAGRCTRHGNDSEPSLMIDQEKNSFYCHGCHEGGDSIQLASWLLGSDFTATVAQLAADFNKGVPSGQKDKKIVAEYDYLDETGRLVFQVVRKEPKDFRQRRPNGRGGWINNMKGVELVPYNLPAIMSAMSKGEPIYIIEGEKDVDSLTAIGLPGTCNSGGAGKWREVHSKYIQPKSQIVILPDNDEPGRKHAESVAGQLIRRDCRVKVVDLPELPSKGDASDWLAAGHTRAELLQIVEQAQEYQQLEYNAAVEDKYKEWRELYQNTGFTVNRWGRLCQIRITKDGTEEKPLALFVARILREVVRDNGQDDETKITFEIDGMLPDGRVLSPRLVPASEFPSMNWPLKAWGADALVLAGTATKDALRVAIQMTGRGARKDRVYCHTGWRKIRGKWCYLHTGGAIGAEGIHVDLSEGGQNLGRYRLTDDTIMNPSEAAKIVIRLLGIAPRRVILPLLAIVFLTPMCDLLRRAGCEPTFLVWLYGQTGQRKSSLAALFLSFFGAFGRDQLPANFKDSRNMTEKLAFLLKDSLLVVDDYHPVANTRDRTEMIGKAQALLRAYGDRAARGRMNADTSLKTAYAPRGLCLISGEDLPDAGESGAARMLAVEIPKGAMNLDVLTECQEGAAVLPYFTAAYLQWFANEWMDRPDYIKKIFLQLRHDTQTGGHGRLAEIVAWLTLGMMSGTTFLESIGEITTLERDNLIRETWAVLLELTKEQSELVKNAKPSQKFMTALKEMLTSAAVQVLSINDVAGLAERDDRRFIGWQDANYMYLLPGLAYTAVHRFYKEQDGAIGVTETTLLKHLEAEGFIEVTVAKDGKVERSRVKRIEEKLHRVIFLPKDKIDIEKI